MSTIITTKDEFKSALERKERRILVGGDLAKKFKRRKQISVAAKVGGGLLIAASAIAIPFTGGASTAGMVAGAGMIGLTIGSVSISSLDLAIIVGGALGMYGIHNKCKVTFNSDGTVVVEPKY
jgi:hypothetical protein